MLCSNANQFYLTLNVKRVTLNDTHHTHWSSIMKFLQNIFSDAFCFDDGGCLPIEGVGGQQCQVLSSSILQKYKLFVLLSVEASYGVPQKKWIILQCIEYVSYIYSILGGWVWVGLNSTKT
jgi:hypothetical protein